MKVFSKPKKMRIRTIFFIEFSGSSEVLPVTISQGAVNPVYLVPTPGMSPNGGPMVSPMMGAQGYPESGSLVNVGSHLVNGPQPPLVYLAPASQVYKKSFRANQNLSV